MINVTKNLKRKKKALITGISGQDGSTLTEILLEKDYEIFGLIRSHSVLESQDSRISHLSNSIKTFCGDLLDITSLEKAVKISQPDEIYNLGAMSQVRNSFDIPQLTTQINCLGLVNLLEAYRNFCPKAKFVQASSSEIFGNSIDEDGYQREETPKKACSPYACTKLFGYSIVRTYRQAYNLFAANSIAFNHEGPRRGGSFVTSKICQGAALIKLGKIPFIELGNLEARRDWSHAEDVCRALYLINNHSKPEDFVVASGENHSVKEFLQLVFDRAGVPVNEETVKMNPKFLRPQELHDLKGDATKIRKTLGWAPKYSFQELVNEMVDYHIKKHKKKIDLSKLN